MKGFNIHKNDTVTVIAGKDRMKTGRVLAVYRATDRALIEGVNYVKKHLRKVRQDRESGILQKESPIHISNLMLRCPKCNKPARIGIRRLQDGSKVRFCKKCLEVI
jgi:large subunit ribosomal protein L24